MNIRRFSSLKERTSKFTIASACLFSMLMATSLSADSVKILNGLNYQGIKIIEIDKGQIQYQSSAGILVKKPLAEIEMISLDNVRELGSAEQDRLRNRINNAITKYKTAKGKIGSNPKGVSTWIDYQLMRAYDSIGDGNMAIRLYLDLMRKRADGFYLEIMPERSIDNITKQQQKDHLSKINSQLKRARGDTKKRLTAIKQMVSAVEFKETPAGTPVTVVKDTGNNRKSGLPARRKSKVFFPRAMDAYERDDITRSLRAGELDNVVKLTTEKLKAKSVDYPSMRILQLGLAQKNLAMKKSGQEKSKALKDCAITLLHIPTYYSSNTNWVGAAYAELGMIHIELKSHEVADRLLNDAQAFVNPAKEPELFDQIVKAREQIKKN